MSKQKDKTLKHPAGLWLINTMMAIQSYASYATSGFLILFYTYSVEKGGLGLDKTFAGDVMAYLGTLGSLLPLLGAYLTDKYIGMQRAIQFGILFNSIGTLFTAFANGRFYVFLTGVLINSIAGAFFRGNLSAMVGALYDEKQVTMKDAAYSLFYMFVNIGSLLGPIIGGLIFQEWGATKNANGEITRYGFTPAFLMVSICLFITFLMFTFGKNKLLGDVGRYPVGKNKHESAAENKADLKPSKYDKGRSYAAAIIFVFSCIFWSAYFQTQTTVTLMTDELVDLNVLGFQMPITWLVSFNGFLCIVLAPAFGWYWMKLAEKNNDWRVATKMGWGMILTGLGFVCFVLGLRSLGGVVDGSVRMSIWYVLAGYFVLTVGELLVSPIGMALFSKLLPKKYAAMSMAIWYFTYVVSAWISGKTVGWTATWGYETVLGVIAIIMGVLGVLMFAIGKPLENMMALDKLGKEHEEEETLEAKEA